MTLDLLSKFDVVVWSNTSGTTLNEAQQAAFRDYVDSGGGFVGIHAADGDPWYSWKWYAEELIGAQFNGHTMDPHFQDAKVIVVDTDNWLVAHLPDTWLMPAEPEYLNNIVEQDHRFIKRRTRPMLGFKSFWSTRATLA